MFFVLQLFLQSIKHYMERISFRFLFKPRISVIQYPEICIDLISQV